MTSLWNNYRQGSGFQPKVLLTGGYGFCALGQDLVNWFKFICINLNLKMVFIRNCETLSIPDTLSRYASLQHFSI